MADRDDNSTGSSSSDDESNTDTTIPPPPPPPRRRPLPVASNSPSQGGCGIPSTVHLKTPERKKRRPIIDSGCGSPDKSIAATVPLTPSRSGVSFVSVDSTTASGLSTDWRNLLSHVLPSIGFEVSIGGAEGGGRGEGESTSGGGTDELEDDSDYSAEGVECQLENDDDLTMKDTSSSSSVRRRKRRSRSRVGIFLALLAVVIGVGAYLLYFFVGRDSEAAAAVPGAPSSSSSAGSASEDGTSGAAAAGASAGADPAEGGTTAPKNATAARPAATTSEKAASASPTMLPTLRPTMPPTTRPSTPSPATNAPSTQLAALPSFEEEGGHPTFSFYVMGDVPYDDDEAEIFKLQLPQMTTNPNPTAHDDGSLFSVHVGDIMKGDKDKESPCYRWKYQLVEHMITTLSPVPTLMLPGDNDWTDCDEPHLAWEDWSDSFGGLEWNWAKGGRAGAGGSGSGSDNKGSDNNSNHTPSSSSFPHGVVRQDTRQENFSFENGGVLFLGLNLIKDSYSKDERDGRLEDNVAWVKERLAGRYGTTSDNNKNDDSKKEGELRALVLFGHASFDDFFDDIWDDLEELDVPVAYFHGNDHEYDLNRYEDCSFPFFEVTVDQGAKAPPLRITVLGTTDQAELLADEMVAAENKDNRYEMLGDFIALDRRGGTDGGPVIVGVGSDNIVDLGGDACGEENNSCGRCEGDCDDDDDCLPGLRCFERDGYEAVPGCAGRGSDGSDYCYDPLQAVQTTTDTNV